MRKAFVISSFIFLAASCSTIKVSERKEKDVSINPSNALKLNGKYSNESSGATNNKRFLWGAVNNKTRYNGSPEKTIVEVKKANDKQLEIALLLNDSLVDRIILKGKYKKGYFSIRKQYDASFKYGPLWTLGDKKRYIGLSKENNLVLITSSSNTVLLILFPIGGAGDNSVISYYHRID